MAKFRYSIFYVDGSKAGTTMEASSAAEVLEWILKYLAVQTFDSESTAHAGNVVSVWVEKE